MAPPMAPTHVSSEVLVQQAPIQMPLCDVVAAEAAHSLARTSWRAEAARANVSV